MSPMVEIGLTDLPKSGAPRTPRDDTPATSRSEPERVLDCIAVSDLLCFILTHSTVRCLLDL